MKKCTNPLCTHLKGNHNCFFEKSGEITTNCQICNCQKFCTVKLIFKNAKFWIDRGHAIDLDIVKEQSKIAVAEYQNKHRAKNRKYYIASKTKYANKWKALRKSGLNIISTWIDEAGVGESKDLSDLATRCIDEAKSADRLILYCEGDDFLKGALIEVGAALAFGVPVYVVGYSPCLETALRNHPLWRECLSLSEAFEDIPV